MSMRLLRIALLTGLACLALPPLAAAEDELALKRVMLSTGGVGYFEYEATVTGDATLSLPVRLDQVDDVLKSVIVFDDSGGVGAISLPGASRCATCSANCPSAKPNWPRRSPC
jgi:hypothetical protein